MGDDSVWDGNGVSLNKLDTAAPGGNGVEIDRIYYRFPSATASPSRPVL
jgi:hypothetical protein